MICYRCKVQFVRYKPRYPRIQSFAGNTFLCKPCYDAIERYIDGDMLYVKDSPEISKTMDKRLVDDVPDCDKKCNEYDYAECPGTDGKCIMYNPK